MGTITGTTGDDILRGGDDIDVVAGGAGSDTLYGGAGNDSLFADDNGAPSLAGEENSVNALYGEGGDDLLVGGAGRDTLDGGAGNDLLFGGSGDTLLGSDGADTLNSTAGTGGVANGGAGDDKLNFSDGVYQLTGGAGADVFTTFYPSYVSTRGTSTITDFRASEGDRISLGWGSYDERVLRGQLDNPNFALRIGEAFSITDYGPEFIQIWTWSSGGDTYLISDRDGTGKLSDQDIVIRFAGPLTIDAKAFVADTFLPNIGTAGVDQYAGAAGADTYYGLNGDDVIHGGGGSDILYGDNGADQIWGDGGNDTLDGGPGIDTAVFSGASTDYSWQIGGLWNDGLWHVDDHRSGGDDSDILRNIEILKFSDKSVTLPLNFLPAIETAFDSILLGSTSAISLAGAAKMVSDVVIAGATYDETVAEIVKIAVATTSVATMSYQFFTGKIPGEPGIDYLVSPTGPNPNNLNSAYYQSFNIENRYINFAVNLGKVGEGKDAFAARYGTLSLFDATREAYREIFGAAPTDAKVHALIDSRVDYFASYGGDGAAGIGTKAAMVGWLLAEAEKADLGVMARSNDAWLTDLADSSAPFAVDILDPAKGYYKADYVFGG